MISSLLVILVSAASATAEGQFRRDIQPILAEACFECHGDGSSKGGVAFDSDQALLGNRDLWARVLKNVRAGLMPPASRDRLPASQRRRLERWIKREALGLDAAHPDPGRVTLRRLNRTEYRNTIRDLLGYDFKAQEELPPDDTGYGFDNIGDVLTMSPLLLEKYMQAAEVIVEGTPLALRPAPEGQDDRRQYAAEVLEHFASRAYRRPVDAATLERLVALAVGAYSQPGKRFEDGIKQAMVPVLASPRFLFRIEQASGAGAQPLVDEYALASRLSYFLWSSMPDDQLFALARQGRLRAGLRAQVMRMLADPRAGALVQNFTGQWLQVRDVEGIDIHASAVLARDEGTPRRRVSFDQSLRRALREETEHTFEHVLRHDRSVLELIDGRYTFLNERLAELYGIPKVTGNPLRLVHLPPGSVRGGVLTQGSVLVVTSNPTRTSPVKRGLFLLENVLGIPPPPPPADVPPLEAAEQTFGDHQPTLREVLAVHRQRPLCRSCHNRMDPLGLALESFNALGMSREQERGQPIDVAGTLITGEAFKDIREVKRLVVTKHRRDFYRCLTEKLLTYALGRGLEIADIETVDQIVDRLEAHGGRSGTLLTAIIESAPFQRRRASAESAP